MTPLQRPYAAQAKVSEVTEPSSCHWHDPSITRMLIRNDVAMGAARRRSEGGHDGGWRLRLVTVANCESADRSIGSASAPAAAPGSLAGLPLSNGVGSVVRIRNVNVRDVSGKVSGVVKTVFC